MNLQTVVSRNVSAFGFSFVLPSVIFTLVQNGTLSQAKPKMGGTIRFFDPTQEDYYVESIRRVVEHTALAYGATAELIYEKKVPPTIMTPQPVNWLSVLLSTH